MPKVEKKRNECHKDKCKKGVVHSCILMDETRTVANRFLIYGLDHELDLRMPPKEDDINKPIIEQDSQFLTQYNNAVKQQE